jgi:hypothetical protein
VVGVRLAKQVQKQQEKLIAGITNVTHVEDDLKVPYSALILWWNGRTQYG